VEVEALLMARALAIIVEVAICCMNGMSFGSFGREWPTKWNWRRFATRPIADWLHTSPGSPVTSQARNARQRTCGENAGLEFAGLETDIQNGEVSQDLVEIRYVTRRYIYIHALHSWRRALFNLAHGAKMDKWRGKTVKKNKQPGCSEDRSRW